MSPTPWLSRPLHAIVHWLCDMYKTNFSIELKVYSCEIVICNTQEPSFSGYREIVKMYRDFLNSGVTNHAGVYACVVIYATCSEMVPI